MSEAHVAVFVNVLPSKKTCEFDRTSVTCGRWTGSSAASLNISSILFSSAFFTLHSLGITLQKEARIIACQQEQRARMVCFVNLHCA